MKRFTILAALLLTAIGAYAASPAKATEFINTRFYRAGDLVTTGTLTGTNETGLTFGGATNSYVEVGKGETGLTLMISTVQTVTDATSASNTVFSFVGSLDNTNWNTANLLYVTNANAAKTAVVTVQPIAGTVLSGVKYIKPYTVLTSFKGLTNATVINFIRFGIFKP